MGTPYFYSERCSEVLDSLMFSAYGGKLSIRCNRLPAVETNPHLATDGSSSLVEIRLR